MANELRFIKAEGQNKARSELFVDDVDTVLSEGMLKRTFSFRFTKWQEQYLYALWYMCSLILGTSRWYGCQIEITVPDGFDKTYVTKQVKALAQAVVDKIDPFDWATIIMLLNTFAYRKGEELKVSNTDIYAIREIAASEKTYAFLARQIIRTRPQILFGASWLVKEVKEADQGYAFELLMGFNREKTANPFDNKQ